MMLTIEECEASGGHHPVPGPRGVSVAHALYCELCGRCPATREGMKPFTPSDSEITWTEWGDPKLRHPLADLGAALESFASAPESMFGHLGEPGDVLTAEMIRGRLLQIAGLASPGALLGPIISELEYLVDQLHTVHS